MTDKEIQKIKDLCDNGFLDRNVAENYFPELIEDKDEIMRNSLINTFQCYYKDNEEGEWDGKPVKEIIAWLKKVNVKQPTIKFDEQIIRAIIGCVEELKQNSGWNYVYIDNDNVPINDLISWLKGCLLNPQKQELSEHDEEIFQKILSILGNERACSSDEHEREFIWNCIVWLKSKI